MTGYLKILHKPFWVVMEIFSGLVTYKSVFPSSMVPIKSPSKLSTINVPGILQKLTAINTGATIMIYNKNEMLN